MPIERTSREPFTGSAVRLTPFVPFRWFMGLSLTGRCLTMAALLLLLICVLFAEENWRGRRDWEICCQGLDAKGARNWQQFVPPQVADDQNFATTPFFAPLFDFNLKPLQPGQSPWRDPAARDRIQNFAAALLPQNAKGELPPARFDGRLTDLEAALVLLQTSSNQPSASAPKFSSRLDAASAMLTALTPFEPVLAELRSASLRPHSRFNIEYDAEDPMSILLPHYLVLTRVTRVLEVRASSELALGKADAAFEDVEFMFRLANSIQDEPFMMGASVRGSMMKRTVQIVWEGLAGHAWSDSQLRQFQDRLEHFKPLKDLDRSLRAERAAFGETAFRFIRGHKDALRMWMASDEALPLAYLLAGPNGWLYQEQVSYHRLYDQCVLADFNPDAGYLQPYLVDTHRVALDRKLTGSPFWHHNGFSKLIFPNVMKTFQSAALRQDRANQAITACALERYRLSHAKYPDAIADLSPQFLQQPPLDVCNGQPLKYRLLADGQFLLYGVGWNEKDDGGAVIVNPDGEMVPKEGDWVWPHYPKLDLSLSASF